jgi:hypothetical protein
MIGSLKPFDEEEHNKWDKKGKDALIARLKYRITDVPFHIENPNKFGIDVLSLNADKKVIAAWEVEVRHENWKGDIDFPFKTINCIERKDCLWKKEQKLFKNVPFKFANNFLVKYVQMNNLCTRAVVLDSNVILEYDLVPWNNRKASNEYVRQVPLSRAIESSLKVPQKLSLNKS